MGWAINGLLLWQTGSFAGFFKSVNIYPCLEINLERRKIYICFDLNLKCILD